jgi:hypothetical protein
VLIGVTRANWDICGLLEASDPNCVAHWCAGATRGAGANGRAACAVADRANRVALLRSIVTGLGILRGVDGIYNGYWTLGEVKRRFGATLELLECFPSKLSSYRASIPANSDVIHVSNFGSCGNLRKASANDK